MNQVMFLAVHGLYSEQEEEIYLSLWCRWRVWSSETHYVKAKGATAWYLDEGDVLWAALDTVGDHRPQNCRKVFLCLSFMQKLKLLQPTLFIGLLPLVRY